MAEDGSQARDGGASDLPVYEDPLGRRIWPRHRRRAMMRAQALGLRPVDANHAFHLLAERGIDVISEDQSEASPAPSAVPATPAARPQPAARSATEARMPAPETRAEAIAEIQRGLVLRRRARLVALVLRLAVFVGLPTAAVAWYYWSIATDMYETQSAFVIQTADNPGAPQTIGGLLAGTGIASSQDSIVVQDYLQSREAFLRLEADHGYMAHVSDPRIDVLQRLPADATLDDGYDHYQRRVTIGYDPTEGVIRMGVVAATPEASQTFSEALVGYAEERVDGLSQEARGDQLTDATARYAEAEERMLAAQQRVLELQQQRGVLSADLELTSQMQIINALELEAEERRLALAEVMDNARPNAGRAAALEREIARLDDRIGALRAQLTQAEGSNVSLARISAELRVAETDLATRQLILQEAIGGMESARLEANRQVRYLSLGVSPIAPVDPTHPRKVEGTILAFVVFLGIYILASLTVSILREQVSV